MEPQHETMVIKNLDKLVDQTICLDFLLNSFLKEGVFSKEDVEKIKLEETNKGRYAAIFKFYSVVITKQNWYNVLLQALQETQQIGIVELINAHKSSKLKELTKFKKPPSYIRNFMLQSGHTLLIVYTIDCKITCDRICETDIKLKSVSLNDLLMNRFDQIYTPVINCETNLQRALYYCNNIKQKCIFVTYKLNDTKGKTDNVDLNKVSVVFDNIEWNDLTSELQTKLLNEVKSHLCLKESICKSALESIDSITLVQLINENIPNYIKKTIPSEISYYIPRNFIIRNTISQTIFNEKGTDMFFFIGMQDEDLQNFPKLNKAITSSYILKEHALDARFVILEEFDHFQQISDKFKTRSLHLIEFKDNKLKWKKSKGNMTSIEQNLESIQRQCLKNGVELLDDLICLQEKSPICILDSPGMGKSIILAHIANEIETRITNIVAFVVISEFLQQVKINLGNMKKDTAIEVTLINYLAANQLGVVYLENNKNDIAELMFDGFDEIDPDDIALASNILKLLRKMFPCTRIWVATRSHLTLELENTLETLGLNLAPFTETDQIQFLTSYWSQNEDTNNKTSYLEYFANKCIAALKSSLKQEDSDIAGVPLQCQLIGEVYEEDALSFCLSSHDNFELSCSSLIRIHSLVELYECVIRKKFKNFRERYEKTKTEESCFYKSHIDQSLSLIFPQFRSSFKTELQHQLSVQDILDVGFFICGDSLWTTRCIHRTFAEYFIAYFLVKTLKFECSDITLRLVIENILRTSPANVKVYNYDYIHSSKYNQHTICYFTNEMLKHKVISDFNRKVGRANPSLVQKITEACVFSGFQNLFKNLIFEAITQPQLKLNIFQTKTLFLAIASKNGCIIDDVLQVYKSLNKTPLSKIQYNIQNVGYTLLHVALTQADYRTVELLIKQEGFEDLLRNSSIIFYITSWLKCNKPDGNVVDNDKTQLIKYLLSYVAIQPYIVTSSSVKIAEQALICSHSNFKQNGVPIELLQRILQMENPKQNHLLSIIYGNEDIDMPVSSEDKVESQSFENTLLDQILADIKVEIKQTSEDNNGSTSLDMNYIIVTLENRVGLDRLINIMSRVPYSSNINERRLHFLTFGENNSYQVLIRTNQINTKGITMINLAKVIFKFGLSLNTLSYYQVTPLTSLVHKFNINNELDVFDLTKSFGQINPVVAIVLRIKFLLAKNQSCPEFNNIEVKDIRNYTLLHIFLRCPNLKSLEILLPFVTDINAVNDFSETPLMILAQSTTFCLKCWEFLIDNGADVLALSKTKSVICHLKSFQYKDSNTCSKALFYSLNKLSTCDDDKVETFVCFVVKSFSNTIVKSVCKWYITTIKKPIKAIKMDLLRNMTILDAAFCNIDGLVLEYIWKVLDCTKISSPPSMPNLIEECMSNNDVAEENRTIYISLALEMFPDLVNTQTDIGIVPLSSKHLKIPFMKLLIENGADINMTDMEGNTPLHWAIKHHSSVESPKCMELVETLLNFKADANAENLCYETPVICALDLSSDDDILICLNILQQHGADLTKFYDNKNTILHLIPHKINLGRFYNFAEFFVQNYLANMFSIENNDGNTPLEIVHELFYLDKKTIQLLEQNGVDVEQFCQSDSSSSESDSESCVN